MCNEKHVNAEVRTENKNRNDNDEYSIIELFI
jgi:hypothetical protein